MKSPRFKDMTGKRFGRLVGVSIHSKRYGRYIWNFKCDCGKMTVVDGNNARTGHIRSCGCLSSELTAKRNYRHGDYGSPEYCVWSGIISRCEDMENPIYGGRGIKVCKKWRESYVDFLNDMGRKPFPAAEIDRINVNGDYEPSNCRWVTSEIQANNKRTSRLVSFNGETLTTEQWARRVGMGGSTLRFRLNSGWDIDSALNKPVRGFKK